MFDATSRYYNLGVSTLQVTDADGMVRAIRYVQRRIIPSTESMTTIAEYVVTQGDRLDTIAARYLGDPTQFWRICDANNVFSPHELTDEYAQTIKITLPNL